MIKPRCRKCGGPLHGLKFPVFENTARTHVVSCVLCGDIYKERIYSAEQERVLDLSTMRNTQQKATCSMPGCDNVSHCQGLCRSHYNKEYNKLGPRHAAAAV